MFDAVRAFAALPEAQALAAANKRIGNILKKAERADAHVSEKLLQEEAEKALYEALAEALPDVERALGKANGKRDYAAALTRLAKLRPAVDAFFDGVMVNAEDPSLRNNRLALLAGLRGLFTRIADLSCLPG